MADKYLLKVTAGPSYDPATHQTVQVNTSTSTHITSPVCDVNLSVRIQNYHGKFPSPTPASPSPSPLTPTPGLPHNSPTTSPYFTHAPHLHDQYSISFTLLPHKAIPGPSLLFGNDFDHPIRDRVPPGFGTALKIVKWGIDPGLDGDVYSDRPHLYGNALSSFNILRVGEKVGKLPADGEKGEEGEEGALEEGGDGDGVEWWEEHDVPETADARKRHFLTHGKTEEWVWEEGRVYKADFFNPYIDFNSFSLKLPGFSLSVLPYLGGEDYLRYVLKNKETDEILFVVVFTLLHKEDVEKEDDSSEQSASETEKPDGDKNEAKHEGEKKAAESKTEQPDGAKGGERHEGEKGFEPQADDLD